MEINLVGIHYFDYKKLRNRNTERSSIVPALNSRKPYRRDGVSAI
jgi:hypothetical protein